jgi:peptidoglycan-N-acetylglucosamine deacetylase
MHWLSIIRRIMVLPAAAMLLPSSSAAQVAEQPVTHGSRERGVIALTFDACATGRSSRYDSAITRILVSHHVPATLFLCGAWMESHPAAVCSLAHNPLFELANHSFDHPHLRALDDAHLRRELARTQDVMQKLTGRSAKLFRPPYGEVDDRIVRVARAIGLTTVQFDLPSGDPDTSATAARLVEYVTRKARRGSIIVMHINGRGWHTAEALPRLIENIRKKGWEFVTVSNLLQPQEETPHP